MSLNDIPKILYKYRSFQENIIEDNRYQRQAFAKGEIYFSSYKELNDPFDLKIEKRYDKIPKEDLILLIAYYLNKNGERNRNLTLNSLLDEAKVIYDKNIGEDIDYYRKKSTEELERRNEGLSAGIFCLSEKRDNILMWSHYGNSNQGFCLGYNSQKLYNHIQTINEHIGIPKVQYFTEYPFVRPYIGKDEDNIKTRLASKSTLWSYEKEWRLIIYEVHNPVIQIPDDIVEEIILGAKTLPETEEKILAIQKQKYPNARIFKVEPDDSEFKLNISPYNP